MIFIESPVFTDDVKELLTEEQYIRLQWYLVLNPTAGDLIRVTGGLRKLRWTALGRHGGKSGGTRTISYYAVADSQIRMILIYRKGIKDDLTPREKSLLRRLNEDWQR